MRKFLAILLSICLLTTAFIPCYAVEDSNKDITCFQFGEFSFDLPDGMESTQIGGQSYIVSLAEDAAWVVMYATDVSNEESTFIEALENLQQKSWADPNAEHHDESETKVFFPGFEVTFTLYETFDDNVAHRYHMVGTFTDTWYVYTYYLTYVGDAKSVDLFNQLISESKHSGKERRFVSEDATGTVEEKATTNSTEPTDTVYSSGMYKVGTDIPAGEYVFITDSAKKGYVCVSSDSNQDDILENENFAYSFFATVKDGQYVEAKRCTFETAAHYKLTINDDDSFGEGMYRVGIDIPAGEYKLKPVDQDGSGYFCIYSNSAVPFDILNNDNFDGDAYVTVKDRQYLLIKRCSASPA